MPQKSKPKQRTNWKQRALHCEEVIGVQNELAKERESKLTISGMALKLMAQQSVEFSKRAESAQSAATSWENRALVAEKCSGEYWNRMTAAEKHNALLLEERDAKIVCSICGEFCNTKLKCESFCSIECITACVGNEQKKAPPTHWQCFKSWLSRRGK